MSDHEGEGDCAVCRQSRAPPSLPALRRGAPEASTGLLPCHVKEEGAQRPEGSTPLHCATVAGAHEAAETILNRLHDVNAVNAQRTDGNTPLHCAATSGHQKLVELFCHSAGVDYTARNGDGLQAWELAKDNDHEACMQIILQAIRPAGGELEDGDHGLGF